MTTHASRREFLRTASRLSLAGVATPWTVNLAAIGAAAAQTAPADYKALVCVFMYGGNDHSNMVVPYDAASYALYAQSRTNLALPQTALLPLAAPANASMGGRQASLRSELQPLKTIYDAGKAAVLVNVGTLVVPTTMAQYRARSVPARARGWAGAAAWAICWPRPTSSRTSPAFRPRARRCSCRARPACRCRSATTVDWPSAG
ncbi:MAG: DUF1501 domain-containing protein [Burkholderiaceae bacterium]|nr:DUF1501 domain-containing protein [Burkholderiaceae bacterium]